MKLASLVIVLAACNSSKTAIDASATQHDAPKAIDAPKQFLDAPPGTTSLTVKNYLAWCSVQVNSGTSSVASVQTVNVAPGTIPLSAIALSGYELGLTPWHDTSGDTGSGDPGTRSGTGQTTSSATTVVVGSTAKCVWVCCETAGMTDCPTVNQCP